MTALFLLLLVGGFIASVWYFYASGEADLTRERIVFGLELPEEEPEEDLADPTYGLDPLAKRVHQLRLHMVTPRGKFSIILLGASIGFIISYIRTQSLEGSFTLSIFSGFALMLFSTWLIYRYYAKRRRRIRMELPYALEMLSALMKGGLVFETALRHLLTEADSRHPLYFEMATLNEAMQRGRLRIDALRLFSLRCDCFEVSELVTGMIQAEQSGASIGDIMRHHAQSIFREVEAEIQKQAEKLPIKLMFPMLFTIFPALFVVLLLPNMLRLLEMIDTMLGLA